MQEYVHVLGDAVKQARLDLRLTQFEVAKSIHANERTIAYIEHYKGNPKMEILWLLLRALGIDANILPGESQGHKCCTSIATVSLAMH